MKKRNQIRGLFVVLAAAIVMLFSIQVQAASKPVPGKISNVKISSPSYNTVNMKWDRAKNSTKYVIYYRESGKKTWTRIATVPYSKNGFTHKASSKYPIKLGKKYEYTIRGYHSKSKKYGPYNSKGYSVSTKPNTPKLNKAEVNKNGTVSVTWKSAGGANKYVVYRKTEGTSWKKLAVVSSKNLKYTDQNPVSGKKNTYTVRSYNSSAKVYGKYDSRGVTTQKPVAPKPTEIPKPTPTPETSYIPVDYIVLDISSDTNLVVGETVEIKAQISPANASRPEVRWESKNPDIISVDQNGRATALKPGKGTIIVKTRDRYSFAEFSVRKPTEPEPEDPNAEGPGFVRVTDLEIDCERTSFDALGQTAQFSAKVIPENATKKNVFWFTTDMSVADVDQNGKVTVKGEGTAKICVNSGDGRVQKTITVVVELPIIDAPYVKVQDIQVQWDKGEYYRLGETHQYIATVSPKNATNKTIRWVSTNEKVATVDQNGVITTVGHGETTIIAYPADGVPGEGLTITVDLDYWPEEPTPTPDPEPTPDPTPDPNPDMNQEYINQVVALVNQERKKQGVPALTADPLLEKAAEIRVKELEKNFAHDRPDGTTCFTVLEEVGAPYYTTGENIAAGQSDPSHVMNSWMNSEGHRGNILNKAFGKIGVGYYRSPQGVNYWVQLFTN